MKLVSYHQIDAGEADYLYVQTSQIPTAGSGLFTAIKIYKDEMIAVFNGEMLSAEQALQRANLGVDRYFIMMPNGVILDSMSANCFAKFANDASVNPNLQFKNNAKIAFDDQDQVGLIALRNINSGEEIFCNYGARYWKKWTNK